MWIAEIVGILTLVLIAIIQTPKEWRNSKKILALLLAFHGIGIASMAILYFVFNKTDNEILKYIMVSVETFYFVFILFSTIVTIFRVCAFYIVRYLDKKRAKKAMGNKKLFVFISLFLTLFYFIPATCNANNISKVEYTVNIEKKCDVQDMRVALVADLHVGAGAFPDQIDQMVKYINDMQADVVLIAGDVVDSLSSVKDLEHLEKAFKQVHSRYGAYYAEGNHEAESSVDPVPYLQNAGVKFLRNEAIILPNHVSVVGMCDHRDMTVADILAKSQIDKEMPCIVIQHQPKGLANLSNDCNLVLCGHTHGYQFPFNTIVTPFLFDHTYGIKQIDKMTVVTTSGISPGNYRVKWPSKSEVVQINVNFRG